MRARATTTAGASAARRARCSGSSRCATRAWRTRRTCPSRSTVACATSSRRTRASTRRLPRSASATSGRSGRSSTPRTPACATCTRSRSPRSRRRWSGSPPRARAARGSWAAGSAARCSRCSRRTRRRRTTRSRCGRGRRRECSNERRGPARGGREDARRRAGGGRDPHVRARPPGARGGRVRHAARRGARACARRARGRGPRQRRRDRRARPRGRRQAQRRPGHEHGHDPREVADRGARGPVVPRRHRAPGARAACAAWRPPAARAHEQLPHARGLARSARALPRPRDRRPARLPPASGAAHPGRRPRARALAGGPRARMVPARPRRPYPALRSSGMLAALRDRGYRYAFVSNADNLGAVLDARLLAWFAASGAPFAMEVVVGTELDRKGGHIARRRESGRLVLRETAQADDPESFRDFRRWRYYNSNNLWMDLDAVAALLDAGDGVIELPLIVNRKRVAGGDTPEVIQLESAMGAAIRALHRARAVCVPRTPVAPVKTTDDLLVLRSDVYRLDDDARVVRDADEPFVELDPEHFKTVADFDRRFPAGPPSLKQSERFVVRGDVTFGSGVVVRGDVTVEAPPGEPLRVPDGAVLE